jgi:AraC-like DNA-binding protein
MYAPIYLPQSAPKSPEVEAMERAIIEAEGAFHVGGRYFASDADARQERRRVAERRVRETERQGKYGGCLRGTCDGTARFRLSTWATERERQQIEAGAVDCVRTTHRSALAEVVADFANGAADGALISAALVASEFLPTLRMLVRGFPIQIVVGLIGEISELRAVSAAVLFGQAGIRAVADVRDAHGWRELRNVFDCGNQPDRFIREALAVVLREIGESENVNSDGRNEFFRLVFSPRVTSAKELAGRLGVLPSTLMSRFFRSALPSPKQYVAYARLVWAAYLAESPGMSIAAIANRLNASSPQSFHRTVRTTMRMSAAEFRHFYTGARMFEMFRSRLITPYRDTLRRFDPTADSGPTLPPRHSSSFAIPFTTHAEKGRAA